MLAVGLALVVLLCLAVVGSILLARFVVHKKRCGDKYVRYGTWLVYSIEESGRLEFAGLENDRLEHDGLENDGVEHKSTRIYCIR